MRTRLPLGMNLLLWSDDLTSPRFFPLFERLRGIGYDELEVPIFDADPAAYERLGRHLRGLGFTCTASTALRPEHDPTSLDPAIRRAAVAQLDGVVETAGALGARLLVGPTYAALGRFTGAGPTADELAFAAACVRAAAESGARCGVTLALEPLNRFETFLINTAADGARFVRAVDHPQCRLMYDTFHAHIEERNVADALAACAGVLVHVHVSECDRGTPGTGQVRWDETFAALAALGYAGSLTVEAFGLALPRLAAATKIWRPLFVSEDALAEGAYSFLQRRAGAGAGPTP